VLFIQDREDRDHASDAEQDFREHSVFCFVLHFIPSCVFHVSTLTVLTSKNRSDCAMMRVCRDRNMPQPARILTYNGESRTLDEWARLRRIPANTIRSRIDKQGWPVDRALCEPLDSRFSKRRKRVPVGVPKPCPAIKEHASGLAYVSWYAGGKQHYRYFGRWGTTAAGVAYQTFAAEWVAGCLSRPDNPGSVATVAELCAAFLEWSNSHYRKNGRETSHAQKFRSALAILGEMYLRVKVPEFTADMLRAFAGKLIAKGMTVRTVNEYQWRVVFAFNWGVTRANIAVPPTVAAILERVEKQIPGRSAAPVGQKVTSAPLADVEAAIPHLHRDPAICAIYAAMVRLQLASGARPGEICAMRVREIERTRSEWRYVPTANKNEHRSIARVLWFGPRSQAILTPILADLDAGDYVFAYPRVKGGEREPISVNLYRSRCAEACKRAGVSGWHPHQLRHNRATELQAIYESDEAVRIGIGDTPEVARKIYVDDPDAAAARRIARECG
jgi:integrase